MCENCQKNEATVHMTQAVGGRIKSIHLCEECAQAMGLDLHGGKLDMGKCLEGMGRHLREVVEGMAKHEERSPAEPPMPAACPLCGMRREEVRRRKIPGCPQCYETFAPLLFTKDRNDWEYAGWVPKEYRKPPVKRSGKGAKKAASKPDGLDREAKVRECRLGLESAKRRLDAAVAAEHYEKAAELRDAIQALRHELESLGEPVEVPAGEAAQP